MKLKRGIAFLLTFVLAMAPVMVSAADLGFGDQTVWLHTWEFEKGLEDQTVQVNKKVSIPIKIKDVAEKQVTVSSPDDIPWDQGKKQYAWTERSGNTYSYDFMYKGPDGDEGFADAQKLGSEFTVEFTPKKTGKYKLDICVFPGNNYASHGELEGSAIYTVTNEAPAPDPQSIMVTGSDKVMKPGKTKQLTATVTPEKASQKVTWSSSDEKVATVSKSGVVTAVKAGNATITAASVDKPDVKGTFKVYVAGIEIDGKDTMTVKVGASKEKKMILTNCKIKSVSSSKEKVAKVSFNGKKVKVKGKKAGESTVTVTTDAGLKVKFKVTVEKTTASLTLKDDKGKSVVGKTLEVKKGKSFKIKVKATPSAEETNEKIKVKVDDEKIAKVTYNKTTGKLKVEGKKKGKAKVKVTAGSITKSFYVKVKGNKKTNTGASIF